jgi:GTPase SAR1 family protein
LLTDRILYKTRLPFILVFNKIDVEPHDFAIEWMRDFEAYQKALNEVGQEGNGETAYSNSLMSSMCLVLEEFYNNLKVSSTMSIKRDLAHGQAVGVSAMTGQGMKEFFTAVEEARQEYET